ncbi:Peptidase M50 [hydrothermal vent metagenome]|uniref:Peptidase M50 n=1 Tax=hydrothermal vent metagenome TaxID=652676 RepID=A0A3B0RY61_9ZZZZ
MDLTDDTPLPMLRDELQFLEGATDGDGQAGFLIFDPVRHRYFRIGLQGAQVLGAWGSGTAGKLIAQLKQKGLSFGLADIDALVRFVTANNLIVGGRGMAEQLVGRNLQAKKSLFTMGLHSYLFFKIPLVRPQRFLDEMFPYIAWLGSRAAMRTILFLTLIGVFLAGQQLDVFFRTFADFANWQGVVLLGVTLVFLKSAHELGHAFVATRYKCQVPVMGVAFMVLFPMLYSDVSDAWRLKNRRQRLMIDGAGMMVEMALGGIALFLWALVPDGPFRTVCFFVATTGWVMSLAINLSPFMRFDGYHLLADGLGIHNLQSRGFAIGRWQLRKLLFGLGEEPPEQFSQRLHRILVAYAWGTWVYRFFLFLGIALLVYFMFFKLLGIFLFVVEIIWFIGLPIFNEMGQWWQRRGEIAKQRRAWVTFSIFGLFLALMFLPLGQSVNVPAVLVAAKEARFHAPVVSQVDEVRVVPGQRVRAGEVLVRLSSPLHREARQRAQLKLVLVDKRLARGGADLEERALRAVLLREAAGLRGELSGLENKVGELVLRATMDGVVSEVAPGLQAGLWVSPELRLVHVVATDAGFSAHGLAAETSVDRLQKGNTGVFISENAGPVKLEVRIDRIGLGNSEGPELVYLASQNGGPVAMDQSADGQRRPANAVYPVLFKVTGSQMSGWLHEQRGTVVVQASAQSIAGRFFRNMVSVLLREAGF